MANYLGVLLMAIAGLHQVVGLFFYREALVAIIRAGVINSVNPPYWERDAAFWFLMFGFLLGLYGWMTHWLIQQYATIPSFWGWGLLGICIIGVVMMPASGFWLAIPIAIGMIRQARHPYPQTTT